jgi:hypothetical protein
MLLTHYYYCSLFSMHTETSPEIIVWRSLIMIQLAYLLGFNCFDIFAIKTRGISFSYLDY